MRFINCTRAFKRTEVCQTRRIFLESVANIQFFTTLFLGFIERMGYKARHRVLLLLWLLL